MNKLDDPINLKKQVMTDYGTDRFDTQMQRNILEIDNKFAQNSSLNKLEFLRNKFRSEINQITDNLVSEVANNEVAYNPNLLDSRKIKDPHERQKQKIIQ